MSADLWTIISSNSTLPDATFWEHLTHQSAGGGTFIVDSFSVSISDGNLECYIDDGASSIEISSDVFECEIADDLSFSISVDAFEFSLGNSNIEVLI